MADADLMDLRTRIAAAQARQEMELTEKGEIPILPLVEWLGEEDRGRLWEIVRRLRRDHASAANRFPEDALPALVVDLLMDRADDPELIDLAQEIDTLAASQGPWLVATPIANIELDRAVIQVGTDAVLLRAVVGREWLTDRSAVGDDDSSLAVHKLLGDRISPVTQWTHGEDTPLDTRRGATLLSVEEGVPGLALPRARARAQYAIAVWTVLSPADQFQLSPDLGTWVPQPSIHWQQRYKLKEEDAWIPKQLTHGGGAFHYTPYPAPSDEVLKLPFDAFANLEKRCAQALLSASQNLAHAMRRSRHELSAQLRNTMACLEVLCEKEGEQFAAEARWEAVAARFDVWSELAHRGYTEADIANLQLRVKRGRNIATHGSDSALLDLGYPESAQRKVAKNKYAPGTDFAYAALAADLVPLRFALGFVIDKLFEVVRTSNWDDATFEAQFN
ncbi:MAG: hypothetical protein ABW167_08900 [Baekduia sp.]